jgi:peptidoglycan L-alanyl-D-glutamate endopeptidase CwlK
MPKFSPTSLKRLESCHPLLRQLMNEVIFSVDCTILEGHRDKERQNALYAAGKSKVVYPNGAHNAMPSNAVDVAPWFKESPHIIWPDPKSPKYAQQLGQWYMFVGYLKRTAEELGIAIRCGADWDGDGLATDQGFHDLPHIELLSTQRV